MTKATVHPDSDSIQRNPFKAMIADNRRTIRPSKKSWNTENFPMGSNANFSREKYPLEPWNIFAPFPANYLLVVRQ